MRSSSRDTCGRGGGLSGAETFDQGPVAPEPIAFRIVSGARAEAGSIPR
ncbi:MAG: hypothetical protein U0V56_01755 [Actinomycetota bacterium]